MAINSKRRIVQQRRGDDSAGNTKVESSHGKFSYGLPYVRLITCHLWNARRMRIAIEASSKCRRSFQLSAGTDS